MPTFKAIQVFEYADEFEFEAASAMDAKCLLEFLGTAMKDSNHRLKATHLCIEPTRDQWLYIQPDD